MRATYSVLISLDLPGQVLDIVKSLTSELRLSSLNNILTSVVEEIYVLHEKEDWVLDMSDQVNILSSDSKYFLEVSIILPPARQYHQLAEAVRGAGGGVRGSDQGGCARH